MNTVREQWETLLKAELKLPDVGSKTTKKMIEGGTWPTLSLETEGEILISSQTRWKKASQSYLRYPHNLRDLLLDDLDSGVRAFFLDTDNLRGEHWETIESVLSSFTESQDLEVVLLGDKKVSHGKVPFALVENLITATELHAEGGHAIQELALLTRSVISRLQAGPTSLNVGVFVDSQFFKNIAKIRAARMLILKVLETLNLDVSVRIIALTSMRDWTLYERYSNMLRNEASVASALIAGADIVQSSGYQSLFEIETDEVDPEHESRSRRMARNTSHILALESMLGLVDDAGHGSFHLENLTEHFAREAWELMQKLTAVDDSQCVDYLVKEAAKVRDQRILLLNSRRHVLAGINDFPDVKEHFALTLKPKFFRVSRGFEELRMRMQKNARKPSVYVALFGEYSALNARLNFVKNYFELLGLTVHEPGHAQKDPEQFLKDLAERKEDVIVLCAQDADYPALKEKVSGLHAREKFVAGKPELEGFRNIFAGQDVYETLSGLLSRWETV